MNKLKNVLDIAMQFGNKLNKSYLPESLLYGYAKLLLMDEKDRKALFDEDERKDLEKVRSFLDGEGVDIELIKGGMPTLLYKVELAKNLVDSYKEFEAFVANVPPMSSSVTVVSYIFKVSFFPLRLFFGKGGTVDTLIASHEKMLQINQREKDSKNEPIKKPVIVEKKQEIKEETKKEINSVISEKTIDERKTGQYRELNSALLDVVKGQNAAVGKFVEGLFQSEHKTEKEKKKGPKSYFFFLGPPGVGKTLLAETAAETLGMPYKIFNMSEYTHEHASMYLQGSSKKYNNSQEGELTNYVKTNPRCLLVFDEIEKAHINAIRIFLQILGSGWAMDAHTEKPVWFDEAIIIFTSNVGKNLYADKTVNLTALPEKVILDAIQNDKDAITGKALLPPEICSRIGAGNMIMFNHLSTRHLAELTGMSFEQISRVMQEKYSIRTTFAKELPLLFLYSRGTDMDARIATRQSGKFISKEFYELVRRMEEIESGTGGVSHVHFNLDISAVPENLRFLFVNESKPEVLVLAGEHLREVIESKQEHCKIHFAASLETARECLKQDISAVFIDPFFGKKEEENPWGISDFHTEGVAFLRELAETQTGLPIFLLESEQTISDYDRDSFIREGAANIVNIDKEDAGSFWRQFAEIMNELYREKISEIFSGQGWVLTYRTRQKMVEAGRVDIQFYDFKKRMAMDVESRENFVLERPKTKFDDIIGAEAAKKELRYFAEYLQNPKRFLIKGGRPPKGILLYGPPGTGKTSLAKAIAGETDIAFISTKASDFMRSAWGDGEAVVRNLFARARRYAPAIIFIDEIDAIGKERTGNSLGVESVLNTLLTEMDGFSTDNKRPVFVMAATNFSGREREEGKAALDEALLRRFDNRIYVELPNREDRKIYIQRRLTKEEGATVSEETIENIAERTTGCSLAILENVLELAIRETPFEEKLSGETLLKALEDYLYGEKKEGTPEYYQSVAIHETGHAIMSYLSGKAPSYITIEARGNFGGYMKPGNTEDITDFKKSDYIGMIRTALAGRAAEQVFYSKEYSLNTGSSGDLQKASNVAFAMIGRYGMMSKLVCLSREEILNSSLAREYIEQVNAILEREMEYTVATIEKHKTIVQRVVDVLVQKNRLTGKEFLELVSDLKPEE